MAQPTRDQAIAALDELHAEVLNLLAKVPEGERATPGIGGGEWSVKDLLGHLAFWEELALEAADAWDRGERPRVAEIFAAGDEGVRRANAEDQERKAAWDYEEVRTLADETHARLTARIREMSDEDWNRKAPYPTEKQGTMVALLAAILGAEKRPFGHAWAHLPDLEAFVTRRLG